MYLLRSAHQSTHQLFLEAKDFFYHKTLECSSYLESYGHHEALAMILEEVDVDDLVSKVPVPAAEVVRAVLHVTKSILTRRRVLPALFEEPKEEEPQKEEFFSCWVNNIITCREIN